jgi:hypothetical protein
VATGDIKAVEIVAGDYREGWVWRVTIVGWAGRAGTIAYDFGAPPTTSKAMLGCTSPGYSGGVLGTTLRTIYATRTLRNLTPDEATLQEVDNGADLDVYIAGNREVYSGDTGVLATFAAGWATSGVDQTNAVAGLAVTNSSTLAYPKPVAKWTGLPFDRFKTDFELAAVAYGDYGIDRVILTATVGAVADAQVATQTKRQRVVSGRSVPEYVASFGIAQFDQGGAVDAGIEALPLVGDAAARFLSSGHAVSANNLVLGICNRSHTIDKVDALDVFAVVSSSGNDTTGATAASAAAAELTPYLTIGAALTDGANRILCKGAEGPFALVGSTVTAPANLGYWYTVEPFDASPLVLTLGGSVNHNTPHFKLKNCTVRKTVQNAWLLDNLGTRFVAVENVATDANGTGVPTVSSFGYQAGGCWLLNSTIDDARLFGLGQNFSGRITHVIDGCAILTPSAATPYHIRGCPTFIGSTADRIGLMSKDNGTTAGPLEDPVWIGWSRFSNINVNGNHGIKLFASGNCAIGGVVAGVELEVVTLGATPSAALWVSADSATSTVHNFHIVGCTFVAERINAFYNDLGTVAYAKSHCRIRYTSAQEINTKGDNFGVPNANRVGNQAVIYGVGWEGNCVQEAQGTNPGYFGINSVAPDEDGALATQLASGTFGDPAYADDQSADGGGAGGGDYTPGAGGDCAGRMSTPPWLCDLDGVNHYAGGYGGANQIPAAAGSGGGLGTQSVQRRRRMRAMPELHEEALA